MLFKHGSFLKKYIQYSHTGKNCRKGPQQCFCYFQTGTDRLLSANISPEKITYNATVIPLKQKKKEN
jgi:hypothetical protein